MDWSVYASQMESDLMALFNHLHAHPEISWQERETTAFLAEKLDALGLRVQTFAHQHGMIAEWGRSVGPVVAMRADMDALWQEVDGEWRANHSCGHDAHMTIMFGALSMLKQAYPTPPVRIRVIYQPAEETGEGAMFMTEQGAVEDVVYLFGVHLRPIQELRMGKMSPAIFNGAAGQIDGVITGITAHGARPHLGINPIEVGMLVMQSVTSLHVNPMIPNSIKMTQFHAGGQSTNVIPESAHFTFDVRAQDNEVLDQLMNQAEDRIRHVCEMMGAGVQLSRGAKTMAARVNDEARQFMQQAILNSLGQTTLADDVHTPGAEDFHFYTALRPTLKATMLGVGCDLSPGLHHPNMKFERSAMLDAAQVIAEAVRLASEHLRNMS